MIFGGSGLGVAACGATHVTEGMIAAAANALAGLVNAYRPVPPLFADDERPAHGVGDGRPGRGEGRRRGRVASVSFDDPIQQVYSRMWRPKYPVIEAI